MELKQNDIKTKNRGKRGDFYTKFSNGLKIAITGTLLFINITKAEKAPFLPLSIIHPSDIARAEHVEIQEENKQPYELDIKTIYELKDVGNEPTAVCGYLNDFQISKINNLIYNLSILLEDGPIAIICERALQKNEKNKILLTEIENAIKNAKKTQKQVKIILTGFCNGETFTITSLIILGVTEKSLWNAEKFELPMISR